MAAERKFAEQIPVLEACVVCTETMPMKILPACQHKLCIVCTKKMTKNNSLVCPLCRKSSDETKLLTAWKLECSECLKLKDPSEFLWCFDCSTIICSRCITIEQKHHNHNLQEWDSGSPVQGLIKSLNNAIEATDDSGLQKEVRLVLEPIVDAMAVTISARAKAKVTALSNLNLAAVEQANKKRKISGTELSEELLAISGKLAGIELAQSDFHLKPLEFNPTHVKAAAEFLVEKIKFGCHTKPVKTEINFDFESPFAPAGILGRIVVEEDTQPKRIVFGAQNSVAFLWDKKLTVYKLFGAVVFTPPNDEGVFRDCAVNEGDDRAYAIREKTEFSAPSYVDVFDLSKPGTPIQSHILYAETPGSGTGYIRSCLASSGSGTVYMAVALIGAVKRTHIYQASCRMLSGSKFAPKLGIVINDPLASTLAVSRLNETRTQIVIGAFRRIYILHDEVQMEVVRVINIADHFSPISIVASSNTILSVFKEGETKRLFKCGQDGKGMQRLEKEAVGVGFWDWSFVHITHNNHGLYTVHKNSYLNTDNK